MKGAAPFTIIAPAGAEVFTHGGAEDVDETILLDDVMGEVLVGASDDVEDEAAAILADVEVVETGVLIQEQPLETLEAKLEQAEAQVGNATEDVPKV